jgi:hypothetical protein
MKVCIRCYASASSGRAVDPESVKMDVKVIGKIRTVDPRLVDVVRSRGWLDDRVWLFI